MRPLQRLISVEQAMAALMRESHPVEETECVALTQAVERVLAEDISSPIDVPPFDRAAMDGYAVVTVATAGASTDTPVALECAEYLYAGSIGTQAVNGATCSEIATGAPLPPGADAVVMVEHTRKPPGSRRQPGERIEILYPAKLGQHITRRGADIKKDELVLQAGTLLTPARVGALAAVGRREVRVYRRPRVKLGATGNEIMEPGQQIGPGQIYNVNSYTLCALFEAMGCEVELMPPAPDDVEAVKQRIREALDSDLVVLSGGSSVGERDILQDAFSALGEILFHGIAVKPGKPTMLARIEGKPVVGMPGYPTSCLSNGYLFIAPAINKIARRPPFRRFSTKARLTEAVSSTPDKFQVFTVRLINGDAVPAFKESGAITSMSRADGFVTIPVGMDRLEAGQEVDVTLL